MADDSQPEVSELELSTLDDDEMNRVKSILTEQPDKKSVCHAGFYMLRPVPSGIHLGHVSFLRFIAGTGSSGELAGGEVLAQMSERTHLHLLCGLHTDETLMSSSGNESCNSLMFS